MEIIAETAWHHDGDFKFLKKLVVEVLDKTQADVIKFHLTLDLDEYMHKDHPAYEWAVERLLSKDEWSELIRLVRNRGRKLMLLFNDRDAIDFGMQFKPELVEIHSVCLNDIRLLEHLRSKIGNETKIVLGVGGSSLYEVENAMHILQSKNIVLMHGFQNYPTAYENINFAKIKKIMQLFPSLEHGYADHTAWNDEHNELVSFFGAALGMNYLEKHVTTQPGEGRTDWQAAITIEQFKTIKEKLELLETCYGDGNLALNSGEKAYSTFGQNKKAAILNCEVSKGQHLTIDHIDFKRSGQSTDLSQIEVAESVGKKFKNDLTHGHCLNKSDLE